MALWFEEVHLRSRPDAIALEWVTHLTNKELRFPSVLYTHPYSQSAHTTTSPYEQRAVALANLGYVFCCLYFLRPLCRQINAWNSFNCPAKQQILLSYVCELVDVWAGWMDTLPSLTLRTDGYQGGLTVVVPGRASTRDSMTNASITKLLYFPEFT